jgi:hypothetical protein
MGTVMTVNRLEYGRRLLQSISKYNPRIYLLRLRKSHTTQPG